MIAAVLCKRERRGRKAHKLQQNFDFSCAALPPGMTGIIFISSGDDLGHSCPLPSIPLQVPGTSFTMIRRTISLVVELLRPSTVIPNVCAKLDIIGQDAEFQFDMSFPAVLSLLRSYRGVR
jgi:hypothetical protein